MPNESHNTFLRNAILIDAAASAAMGVMMAAAAIPLSGLLGLPEELLRICGLALLPYAAILGLAGTRPAINLNIVLAVIAGNVAWVIASGVLLVSGWVSPTALGLGFVILQALAVLGFAELQIIGYRRRKQPLAMMA